MLDGRAVVNAPDIPSLGQSHPSFRDLRVVNKSAGPGLAERIVSVRYQWMPQGWTPNQTGDDPIAKVPTVSWSLGNRTEPTDIDINGNVICNSAGDVFSNLPSKTTFSLFLRITRWERTFDIFKTRAFVNKVNAADISAGNVIFKARSMLCTGIAPASEFSIGAETIQMAYDFEIRPTQNTGLPTAVSDRPFAFWTVDLGVRSYNGERNVLGAPSDLFDANYKDRQIQQDVRLNGQGVPLDASAYVVYLADKTTTTPKPPPQKIKRSIEPVAVPGAVFLGFNIYEEIDFRGLGL